MRRLIDRLLRRSRDLVLLDHVPVQTPALDQGLEWRAVALARAAQRLGKPFRCAARNHDREVIIVPGEVRVIQKNRQPTRAMLKAEQDERARAAAALPRIRAKSG
jgi:hypothetical protein